MIDFEKKKSRYPFIYILAKFLVEEGGGGWDDGMDLKN